VIKIVTDSTCYLPPALLAEHDVRVIPLTLLFGRQAYREGIDIDTERFFEKLSREKTFPTTSQPNTQDFLSVWQPLLDAGHEVLSILLSGRLSGTLEAAQAAAQLLPKGAPLSIVDSLSVAMGLGMQVLRAAEMARAGFSRERIAAAIEHMRKRIRITLVLDTLEYVHRGGRINTAQAWVGTLLRVKPMLTLRKGVIEPLEQVRTAQRAFARMLDRTLDYLGDDRRPWISVMHSRSPGAAKHLLDALKPRYPGARFFCSEIGPVLGVHVGPGGSGVIACPSTAL
jgi:DegV family protein with EDD domain